MVELLKLQNNNIVKLLENLNNIKTDTKISDNFITEYLSKTSNKRMFDMYMMFSDMIKNSNKTERNDFIKNGITELLSPFFKHSMESTIEYVSGLKRTNDLVITESIFSTYLSKATSVKRVSTYFIELSKEVHPVKHGISVYISKNLPISNRLFVNWNNGFFQISDGGNVSITVFIPIQYVNALMIKVQAIMGKDITRSVIPQLEFRTQLKLRFEEDLIKAFFHAIYRDTLRIKMVSDIIHLINIGKDESFVIRNKIKENSINNKREIITTLANKYEKSIKEQYYKTSYENTSLFEDVYKAFALKSSVKLNPIDFYNLFVHIPQKEVDTIMLKCGFDNDDLTEFNNTLTTLQFISKSQDSPAIIADGLMIERILPFVLYNEYILSKGSNHAIIDKFIKDVKDCEDTINMFKAHNMHYSFSINALLSNISYFTDTIYPIISSPVIFSSSVNSILNMMSSLFYAYNDLIKNGE